MRICLLVCVVLLAGCRKKSSPEFYKLEGAQSTLVAQEGDDAYVSPEMATLIAQLNAVPEDVIEKPRAIELAARLSGEKARVTAERVEKPKPPEVDPFEGRTTDVEPEQTPPPVVVEEEVAVVDAGPGDPGEPSAGMDEATFDKLFGKCFSKGPNATVGKGLAATTKVLVSSPDCQKRLGTPGSKTSYLFVDGGVWGTAVERVEVTVTVDAGQAPPPPPPPDAGEPILTFPGAPMPSGYEKAP